MNVFQLNEKTPCHALSSYVIDFIILTVGQFSLNQERKADKKIVLRNMYANQMKSWSLLSLAIALVHWPDKTAF